jgi:uncharacterized protein (DUF885 family)
VGSVAREFDAGRSEFRSFLRADWEEWLGEVPEIATAVGFPGLNDRWTDDSTSGISARRRHLEKSLARLRAIDRTSLPSHEHLNYDLYRELLESSQVGLRYGDDALPFRFGVPRNLWMPLNQIDGIQINAPDVLELQPRVSVADYEAILGRLRRLPLAVDQNLALLVEGLRQGFSPPRIAVRDTPEQVAQLVPDDPQLSPLLRPFAEFPVRFPTDARSRFSEEARSLYQSEIVPAFHRLHDYLVRTYLPACRETVGTSDLPDGAESYVFRVRWQTTTDLSPTAVHEIGLREVRRIRSEMERLIAATGFSGGFAEFLSFLRTDPKFFYETPEQLLDGYRILTKRCDPELARIFGRLPRLPYGVRPVPSFRAANAPTAYYSAGAPSAGRAGYFYANTHEISTRARWQMEALALHESVPGHHLQLALAQELEDLPDFRRYSGYTAFIEGWGLYAESLGEELGFFGDAYSKFGQLSFDMWRSVRLVVDTGLHAMGWSREQAVRFFRENAGNSEQDIGVEVDRYLVWPAQALAYKIGQLKFRELREFAERQLGDRFDVRAFHDRLLERGALPLGEVEAHVRRWVDALARSGSKPAD